MFTTSNVPFSRFITLLDTPSDYEDGKLLVFDAASKQLKAYYPYEIPFLEQAVINGFKEGFEESSTIQLEQSDKIKLGVKSHSITSNHIQSENEAFDNAILIYKNHKLYWSYPSNQVIELEAKESIQFLQPVSSTGHVAVYEQPITNQAIGIALHDCQANFPVIALVSGKLISTSWTWSAGTAIYLGDKVLTHIAPTNTNLFVQKMGIMMTSNILLVNINQPILL